MPQVIFADVPDAHTIGVALDGYEGGKFGRHPNSYFTEQAKNEHQWYHQQVYREYLNVSEDELELGGW